MRQSISLTVRLSLLFAASSACVLLVAGLLLEHAGANEFLERDSAELYGKMELIQNELLRINLPVNATTLPLRVHDIVLGHPGIAIIIKSQQGKILFSTGPEDVVRYLSTETWMNKPQPVTVSYSDRSYRVMADRLMLGGTHTQFVNVDIGLDITKNQSFLYDVRQSFWFGMALALMAMGWLGWAVVHKGLAPLHALSETMENVSAQQLGTKISVLNSPSELRVLIHSFNTMLAKLDDSFRRLSNFSSDIAHELRSPVHALMMQTQVTLSQPRETNEYRDALQSNMEELERLSRMISDILFLAKADNKQLTPKREPIVLHNEVDRILEYYSALAADHAITLRRTGLATLDADRLMLQRAVSNLLSNAIRFTPNGGVIEISMKEKDDGVLITVANPGPDIPAIHLPRIFERLYRVDAARREGSSDNVGLGLAITKSIVTLHGGTIDVSSEHGWTRFAMMIPKST